MHKDIAKSSKIATGLYTMLFGYARVSTQDQDTAAQIAALQSAGCELIFQETQPQAADGNGQNCIACSGDSRKEIWLLSGSSTACRDRSKTF